MEQRPSTEVANNEVCKVPEASELEVEVTKDETPLCKPDEPVEAHPTFKVTKPKSNKSKAIRKDPVNDSLNTAFDYKCPFCPKQFQKSAQLGGHVSKGHPGHSLAYKHKQEVRDSRTIERQYQKVAKIKLTEQGVDIKRARQKVTELKKKLMEAADEPIQIDQSSK